MVDAICLNQEDRYNDNNKTVPASKVVIVHGERDCQAV